MKHLVKVTAEFEFVILVDDEEDEHQVCENFVVEALRDMSTSDVLFNTEAYHDGCIDGWDGTIEPYNGAGKSTDEWAGLLPDNAEIIYGLSGPHEQVEIDESIELGVKA